MSTARSEADLPEIQSGLLNGHTTGTPLCAVIRNTDTRSKDYDNVQALARPSHADYTGFVRYEGWNDIRGGGHFSGRLTAPLVFAGAVAAQALEAQGITVGARIAAIHGVEDSPLNPAAVTARQLTELAAKYFPVLDEAKGKRMREEIEAARMELDSVGGVVECCAVGLPAGIGSPMFDGVENSIASLLFGVPAVRGLEFGEGFAAARLRGSNHNDPMFMKDGQVRCQTNRHGGILGGITSGMPLVLRVAFKPTASIAQVQQTVDYKQNRDAEIEIHGRHDPCIVPRAVVCVEACVALAILDCGLEGGNPHGFDYTAR